MDPSELASLKEQVADLETALLSDPNNEDLLTLKTELLELISLTETVLQQEQQLAEPASSESKSPQVSIPTLTSTATKASPGALSSASSSPYRAATETLSGGSTPVTQKSVPSSGGANQPIYQPPAPTRHWVVGDRVRALYTEDGKYYEATILGVGAGANGQVYSVQYVGYTDTPPATLGADQIKPIYDHKKHHPHAGADEGDIKAGQKRGSDGSTSAGPGSGIKKKKKDTGPSEQVQKQMAWQNFAKGGSKKGKSSGGGLLKKSIFATPDNPEGKVGVVGSGKGMTQFQQRGKHLFGNLSDSH
ncbi:hypothetical protein FBU30_001849 [Linnemannia zychae]|nr:hypothetical protein FBU30_001849 [Linnemannia zychae]